MKKVDNILKAMEQARRRKKELKDLIEVLYKEYDLVKAEIKLHRGHIEKLLSEKEYAAFLDTLKMDTPLEFPAFTDRNPTEKKTK